MIDTFLDQYFKSCVVDSDSFSQVAKNLSSAIKSEGIDVTTLESVVRDIGRVKLSEHNLFNMSMLTNLYNDENFIVELVSAEIAQSVPYINPLSNFALIPLIGGVDVYNYSFQVFKDLSVGARVIETKEEERLLIEKYELLNSLEFKQNLIAPVLRPSSFCLVVRQNEQWSYNEAILPKLLVRSGPLDFYEDRVISVLSVKANSGEAIDEAVFLKELELIKSKLSLRAWIYLYTRVQHEQLSQKVCECIKSVYPELKSVFS